MSPPPEGPSFGALAFGAVAAVAALLLVMGPPRPHPAPLPRPAAPLPSVAGGGFTLTSAAVELPTEDVGLPPGPHGDAVQANCTSCHSPAMILQQPPLTREAWQAEVKKMREVYHAPVDDAAVPGIVDYLAGLKRT